MEQDGSISFWELQRIDAERIVGAIEAIENGESDPAYLRATMKRFRSNAVGTPCPHCSFFGSIRQIIGEACETAKGHKMPSDELLSELKQKLQGFFHEPLSPFERKTIVSSEG